MIRKFLAAALLLCATAQNSHAHYVVEAHLQNIATGPHGRHCAEVLVDLWDIHIDHSGTQLKGTEFQVHRGTSIVCVGDCLAKAHPSKCPPVTVGDRVYYSDSTSPVCATVWLNYPGVSDMVTAAIDQPLLGAGSSSKSTEDHLQIFQNPAGNIISIKAQAKDLDGAEFNIFDPAGKAMDAHQTFNGGMPSLSFTLNVSGFPKGDYTASLTMKDGRQIVARFTLR